MIGHVLVNTPEVITNDYSINHDAIDIVGAGNSISDVIALEEGTVELVVSNVIDTDINSSGTASYGNFVKIKHKNGQKTLYAHLQYGSVTVSKGDIVTKGEKIGTMGATGKAFGVHLHFEVRNYDETRENPYEYLWGSKQIRAPAKLETKHEKIEEIETIIKEGKEEIVDQEMPAFDQTKEKVNTVSEPAKKIEEKSLEEKKQKTAEFNKENISVKKEKVIVKPKNKQKYLVNKEYQWYSIVDALKDIGVDSSYSYRSLLASKNNIENYSGTSSQNLKMLDLLKKGKLANI